MCFDFLRSLHPEAGDLEDGDLLWFPKHCILKAGCDRRHHSRLGAETLQLQGWLLLLRSSCLRTSSLGKCSLLGRDLVAYWGNETMR